MRKDSPKKSSRLEVEIKDLREKTASFFDRLDADSRFRSEFLANPSGTALSNVFGSDAGAQQASAANRVLFAMLANDRFRTWLETYETQRDGKTLTREEFARDFAKAIIDYADRDIIDGLFSHYAEGFGLPGFQDVYEQFVTGPEKSIVTPAATPSPTTQKTESTQNFEHKGIGFGDFSAINPAQLRAVMEQLISHAKALSQKGLLKSGER